MNDYGGYVSITSSTFENFNTCGSIIRNKALYYSVSTTPTTYPTYFSVRANNLQNDVYSILYESFTTPYSCSGDDCYSITLSSSTFQYFGQMKANFTTTTPIKVDASYKMQYTGMILDLDSFEGTVSLTSNTFTGNVVGYYSCSVAVYLDQNLISLVTSDDYWNFGSSKTKF